MPLRFCLLCGEKMHEDCEGITGILPVNTESSSMLNGEETIHL